MNERTVGTLVALVAVATLPLGILAVLFVGPVASATVFVVGWLLLVPTLAILGGALGDDDGADADDATDPIEEAKRAYARGEIDEAELERRTGVILEAERAEEGGRSDRDRELDVEFE
jgi:hypothetical protein